MGSVATIARPARATESLVHDRRVLSRQRILCSDRLYNVCCHDREIFVVIDFSRTPVVTEFSLSQQSLHSPCRDRVSCVVTRRGVGRAEVYARATVSSVRTTARSECALCM